MNIKDFWTIIDQAREESDGWENMYEPLVERLSALDVSEILLWKNIFDEYQNLSYKNKLWAAAYIINGGCSDDGFDYFRGWLTAQGKSVFLKALKDPDSLADEETVEEDIEFEDMLGVASDAYFNRLGIEEPDYDRFYNDLEKYPLPEDLKKEMVSEIEYPEDIDIEWDEDDGEELEKLLPKLCKAFDW
ncbi:MAG: DUF4240 domain-containing protein [Flavobacteriaceae bacterium]|jgi:hypothetical protein|nr:DUF4240 domain-containing protein [Flavobacteriaceae bacterium]